MILAWEPCCLHHFAIIQWTSILLLIWILYSELNQGNLTFNVSFWISISFARMLFFLYIKKGELDEWKNRINFPNKCFCFKIICILRKECIGKCKSNNFVYGQVERYCSNTNFVEKYFEIIFASKILKLWFFGETDFYLNEKQN